MALTQETEIKREQPDRRAHCNLCLNHTHHSVIIAAVVTWEEDISDWTDIYGSDTYSMIQCKGCGSVRMLNEKWFSEDCNEDGRPIVRTDYHPPTIVRSPPDWLFYTQSDIWALLTEVYAALGAKAYRVATMGIRAVVEWIMIDKVGDLGSFESNIKAFFDAGFVALVQQSIFKGTLIEAGHAAMHRDWSPTADDVNVLLDILEPLIRAIYVEPRKAGEIGSRIPARKSRPKSSGGQAPP